VGKFVSYLRVSTKRQGRSGLGLEAQRATVVAHLSQAHQLVAEVVEHESGRRSDRPELDRALVLCRAHKATLIVAKLDRLARNASFLLSLRDSGVEFVSCDVPSMNRMVVGIMACVAEEEARLASERTKAALAAAKRRGVQLGNPQNLTRTAMAKGRPLAWQATKAKADARARELAPVLVEIQGNGDSSLRAIAAQLNARGIAASHGGRWAAAQVARLLVRAQ
jgi:DNA invertase Pin-like site-specific DNA recombinase